MRKIFIIAAVAALAFTSTLPAEAAQNRHGNCADFFGCLFKGRHRGMEPPGGYSQTPATQLASQSPDQPVLSGASRRETVNWNDPSYKAGTIIVRTPERALYFVQGDGTALKYAVGVGREGFQWSGTSKVAAKAEWPGWTPPSEMIAREAKKGHMLPPYMEGGPGNPLGARAMYLGGRMYRIHGTNNEASIGGEVSSGCIRMMNADVIDLYDRVKVGAKVIVLQ